MSIPSNSASVGGSEKNLKMVSNGSNKASVPVTPNTLAKMEDPRAWHARGEVGIAGRKNSQSTRSNTAMIAMPMAPPIPRGGPTTVPKKVLEEEEYVDRLGDIIENDYFPHNAKMTRALAGLGGAAVGVTPSAGFIGTPSSAGLPTPGGSSSVGGDVSASDGGEGEAKTQGGKERAPGGGGALTRFVATHTSEDNQAFTELQEKDQEAFRRRYFWAYDNADGGEGHNATATKLLILPNGNVMSVERREQMDAACADRPKISDHRPNQVDTWKHRTRNQLMFQPTLDSSNDTCKVEQGPEPGMLLEGAASTIEARSGRSLITQQAEDASEVAHGVEQGRKAATSAHKAGKKPANRSLENSSSESEPSEERRARADAKDNYMCTSDFVDESERQQPSSEDTSTEDQRARAVDGPATAPRAPRASRTSIVLKTNAKGIQAEATRFPVPKAKPRPAGAWASPIESPNSARGSVKELLAGETTGDTQEYAEVPMTPSRVPGADGDSPQITWGSIDGTPMILDPRMTPLPDGSLPGTMSAVDVASVAATLGPGGGGGRQFEVKDLPARDKLAHRLEAEDTRRKRARPGTAATDDRGTALRTPGSLRTPLRTPMSATGRRDLSSRSPRGPASPAPATLTPAGRMLAAKLANRRGGDTPFGGGLTPGSQKKRHRSSRRGVHGKGDGLTPLPGSTPGGTPVGGGGRNRLPTPMGGGDGVGKRSDTEKKTRSSLTDGLLALK